MNTLGDRMKGYEKASRVYLPGRMPMIIRCDGKAFHTFTRGMEKPWDLKMRNAMTAAGKALVEAIQGAKLAYIQSDEISVLVTDYDSLEFDPWYNKAVQKIVSVSAAIATQAFNGSMQESDGKQGALFDARSFVLPKEDVCNYFVWRQQDAVRNSIQGLGQSKFSHKELHKKNIHDIQEMLHSAHGINWNNCEVWEKRGWTVIRKFYEVSTGDDLSIRSNVEADWNIPTFSQDRKYVESRVFINDGG